MPDVAPYDHLTIVTLEATAAGTTCAWTARRYTTRSGLAASSPANNELDNLERLTRVAG